MLNSFFKKNIQRLFGLFLLFLNTLIAISIFSYDKSDPSINRASGDSVNNIIGQYGANIADITLQLIGNASFIALLVLPIIAFKMIFNKANELIFLKLFFLTISTIFLAGLLDLLQTSEQWTFYVGYGGIVGKIFYNSINKFVGVYIYAPLTAMLFITTLFLSLTLKMSELKIFITRIYTSIKFTIKYIIYSLIAIYNIFRKIRKKDTIKVQSPKGDEERNLVEFKKKRTTKKPKPKQKSLKLTDNQYEIPDYELLVKANHAKKTGVTQTSLNQNAKILKQVLEDFGIDGEIVKIRPGPVVTLYELEPAPGTKASRVIGLADDIARSMSALSARIAVVPGRNVLGIELPNTNREIVYLRELIEVEEYLDQRIHLPIALGKDIGGTAVMTDLSRMPHLLVAGTTGSGKSVAVNAMILSLLYRLTPDQCKFIMIDPKMLELSVYEGIPHLLSPVVTEPAKAVVALKWAVREMENRYKAMSDMGVRNVAGYNKKIMDSIKKGEVLERTVQTGFNPEDGSPIYEKIALEMEKLPYIVIIVDEMADLMLTAGKDVESSIQRLAQMARAAGIHLVMATQRPSVDVITGVIKANFPTRISFQVTSRIDSRTILGEMGAEQLLGMGDMLYMATGGRVTRVHGPFVDDKEVEKVVNYLKTQGEPNYVEDVTKDDEDFTNGIESSGDELYDKAVAIVLRDKKASTSYIQRQLRIGYNRAANLIEQMEREGVISEANHAGKREILVI